MSVGGQDRSLTRGTSETVQANEQFQLINPGNASFLVEVAMAEKFDGALECLAREHADVVRFKCVGPLPPHSFVSLARD